MGKGTFKENRQGFYTLESLNWTTKVDKWDYAYSQGILRPFFKYTKKEDIKGGNGGRN